MISDVDAERVASAGAALPPAVHDYLETDYVMNLLDTVIDYQMHSTAVERALNVEISPTSKNCDAGPTRVRRLEYRLPPCDDVAVHVRDRGLVDEIERDALKSDVPIADVGGGGMGSARYRA